MYNCTSAATCYINFSHIKCYYCESQSSYVWRLTFQRFVWLFAFLTQLLWKSEKSFGSDPKSDMSQGTFSQHCKLLPRRCAILILILILQLAICPLPVCQFNLNFSTNHTLFIIVLVFKLFHSNFFGFYCVEQIIRYSVLLTNEFFCLEVVNIFCLMPSLLSGSCSIAVKNCHQNQRFGWIFQFLIVLSPVVKALPSIYLTSRSQRTQIVFISFHCGQAICIVFIWIFHLFSVKSIFICCLNLVFDTRECR